MAPLLVDRNGVSVVIHSREHLPPHIHAIYGDSEALVDIRTGKMFEGYLPGKKLKIVQEWLAENNNRTVVEGNFYELNPGLKPVDNRESGKKHKKKGGK